MRLTVRTLAALAAATALPVLTVPASPASANTVDAGNCQATVDNDAASTLCLTPQASGTMVAAPSMTFYNGYASQGYEVTSCTVNLQLASSTAAIRHYYSDCTLQAADGGPVAVAPQLLLCAAGGHATGEMYAEVHVKGQAYPFYSGDVRYAYPGVAC